MSRLPSFFIVQLGFAPLPPFIANALSEIEVETSVEGAAMFRLHIELSRTMMGDFDAIVFDLFRPMMPIRISLSFGLGLPLTLINGYIRDVQMNVGSEPGTSRMEVVGADALGTLMGHVQMPFTWPNMPDNLIASAIFGKYAIVPLAAPTPLLRTILDTTTTQNGRDNAFLQQLASKYGFQLYIQPDPLAGFDVGHFHPPITVGPPQGVLSVDFGSQSNLRSFQISNQMLKPTTVLTSYVDPLTRMPVPVFVAATTELPMGLEPSLYRVAPPAIEVDDVADAANPAEKMVRAVGRVTESGRTVSANGEVDPLKFGRPLLPGLPVLVRGAGRQHSGMYSITSVTHKISRDAIRRAFRPCAMPSA
ncbi:MAG: hypothetical protein ACR2KT_17380 [Methylocella sp.]